MFIENTQMFGRISEWLLHTIHVDVFYIDETIGQKTQ